MNKPILTIGIPTYNSGRTLRECLRSITDQFSNLNVFERVEIVLSDNGSQDDTVRIIEEYRQKFPNIRYSRNETNLEFDRNVDAVLHNAKGDFCWTLSSNEYVEPGSVARVLAAIEQHADAGFLCISNRKQDKDIEVRRFANGNEWLKEMGVFGGQISQCIFNMQYIMPDRSEYYDNMWIHLSIFWETSVGRPILLLPCLFRLPDVDPVCGWAWYGGGGHALKTHASLKNIVEQLPRHGYDQEIIDDIMRGFARGLPRNVASAKRYGLPMTWDRFSFLVKEYYAYPLYLSIAIGVFLTPSILLRAVKKMK